MAREWLRPGTLIHHFEIKMKLSSSSSGDIYLARDNKNNRNVALKLLPKPPGYGELQLCELVQLINSANLPPHPHICALYEAGLTENGGLYVASEYLEGQSLDVSGQGRKVAEVIQIAIQIARALDAAHKNGVLHTDLKPANLMLINRYEQVKVLDFVLAQYKHNWLPPAEAEARLPGITPGQVRYFSPEKVLGEQLTPQADIFSLGAVLYEMLTSQPPFVGRSAWETGAAILQEEPPPINEYNREASAELCAIIEKTLYKDRRRRYGSAEELLKDLLLLGANKQQTVNSEPAREQKNKQEETRPPTPTVFWEDLRPVLSHMKRYNSSY